MNLKGLFFIVLFPGFCFAELETSEEKRALAYSYEQQKNPKKAFQFYQEAVHEDGSNSRALHDLALCYKDAYGTSKDVSKYAELMHRSADLGNPKAMLRMAEIYGASNWRMALYWISQAAQHQYAESAEDKKMVTGAQQDLYRNLQRFKHFNQKKAKMSLNYEGLQIDVIDLNHQAKTAIPKSRILLLEPKTIAVLPENDDPRTPPFASLTFVKDKYSQQTVSELVRQTENGHLGSQLEFYRLLQDHFELREQFLEIGEISMILDNGFSAKGIRLDHFSKKALKEKSFSE